MQYVKINLFISRCKFRDISITQMTIFTNIITGQYEFRVNGIFQSQSLVPWTITSQRGILFLILAIFIEVNWSWPFGLDSDAIKEVWFSWSELGNQLAVILTWTICTKIEVRFSLSPIVHKKLWRPTTNHRPESRSSDRLKHHVTN